MAVYQIDKILEDVRVSLDMNSSSDTLAQVNDTDTLSLNDIIKSKIIDGVRIVHSAAPIYLLDDEVCDFGNNLYWREELPDSGFVLLPDDFMRLIAFRMSDWSHAVYNAITPAHPEYMKQSSPFKGIRGNCQKPVCAIVLKPEGMALEFYSCKDTNAGISEASYLPYPIIENERIKICQKCYQGTIYTIASLVSATLGNTDMQNMFNELAKSTMI